jgi:hypothetical protein
MSRMTGALARPRARRSHLATDCSAAQAIAASARAMRCGGRAICGETKGLTAVNLARVEELEIEEQGEVI